MMLPANPLHHLLMQETQRPLVMTSGNLSGRPPAISNRQALEQLAEIADGFLLHNRDILQRMDDSYWIRTGPCCVGRVDSCRMPSRYPPVLALFLYSGDRCRHEEYLLSGAR